MLTQIMGPQASQIIKDTAKFAATKANEAVENSKEQTMLLREILDELKVLNKSKKGGS